MSIFLMSCTRSVYLETAVIVVVSTLQSKILPQNDLAVLKHGHQQIYTRITSVRATEKA